MNAAPFRLGPAARWGLSLVIVLHLAAVFGPPMAFQARGPLGASPSVETLMTPVRGYGEFLYLNRGYAFFAPDPGPSHLFQVSIRDRGGKITEPTYPDLDTLWPRLLYHRHFMLAEFLHEAYQPAVPADLTRQSNPGEFAYWTTARRRYEMIRQSFVDHISERNPECEIAIRRLEHVIPNFQEFNDSPISLEDRRLYNVLLDQSPDPTVSGEILP